MENNKNLKMLARELDGWRSESPSKRRPLPTRIWSEAASLAGRMGVTPVATALRLDHAKLKRLVHSSPGCQQPAAVPTFLELLPLPSPPLGECAIEVEATNGARMHIHLQNATPSGLAGLIREFVG
jgi:hypothetical protein